MMSVCWVGRIGVLTVAAVCLQSASAVAQNLGGINLLQNGGFEQGSAGWNEWKAVWSRGAHWEYGDREPGCLGKGALHLSVQDGRASFGVYQEVAVIPGHTYRVDAYWKGKKLAAENWCEIILLDGQWNIEKADSGGREITHPNFAYAYEHPEHKLATDFGWVWTHAQNGTHVDCGDRHGLRTASGKTMTVVLQAAALGLPDDGNASIWFDEVSLVDVTDPKQWMEHLMVSSSEGGEVLVRPVQMPSGEGESGVNIAHVEIEARPTQGFRFDGWSGTATDTGQVTKTRQPKIDIAIDRPLTLQANFQAEHRYDLVPTEQSLWENGDFEIEDLSAWRCPSLDQGRHLSKLHDLRHVHRARWIVPDKPRSGESFLLLHGWRPERHVAYRLIDLPAGPSGDIVVTGWYASATRDAVRRHFLELHDGGPDGPIMDQIQSDQRVEERAFVFQGTPQRKRITLTIGYDKVPQDVKYSASYLDNVKVTRLVLTELDRPALSAADAYASPEILESLRWIDQGRFEDAIKQLEALQIQRARPAPPSELNTTVETYQATIPQICCALAAARRAQGRSSSELEPLYYNAIRETPDDPTVRGAIIGLVESSDPALRENILRNLVRQYSNRAVARFAAEYLVERIVRDRPLAEVPAQLTRLLMLEPDPCVVQEAVRRLSELTNAPDRTQYFKILLASEMQKRSGPDRTVLRELGDALLELGDSSLLEELCDYASSANPNDAMRSWVRRTRFLSRSHDKDLVGALAALLPPSQETSTASLPAVLSQIKNISEADALLEALLIEAASILEESSSGTDAWRAPYYNALTELAQDYELWWTSCACSRAMLRVSDHSIVSLEDGAALDPGFMVDEEPPALLASFYRAHHLLANNRYADAQKLFHRVSQKGGSALVLQARVGGVRALHGQGKHQEALVLLDECIADKPDSRVLQDLRRDIKTPAERQAARDATMRQMATAQLAARDAADPKQACQSMLRVADLELQLDVPLRAVRVLQELIAAYPDDPSVPDALKMLITIHRDRLNNDQMADRYMKQLQDQFPGYVVK